MHELVHSERNTFKKLLLAGVNETGKETTANCDSQSVDITHIPGEKMGPRPKHVNFPGVVEETVKFIQLHGFAAHARWRTTTGNMCGVTVKAVKRHLLQTFPKLQSEGISLKVRYLVAPNKRRSAAAAYKGLIYAKVPPTHQ